MAVVLADAAMRMFMPKLLYLTAAAMLCAGATGAQAVEVSWKGGITAVATTGCIHWNPLGAIWYGSYLFPIAGTNNGDVSALVLREANVMSFQKFGAFSDLFQAVTVTDIYTRAGTYNAQLRIVSQTPAPAAVTSNTPLISMAIAIKGWDRTPGCQVNMTASFLRHVENQ